MYYSLEYGDLVAPGTITAACFIDLNNASRLSKDLSLVSYIEIMPVIHKLENESLL